MSNILLNLGYTLLLELPILWLLFRQSWSKVLPFGVLMNVFTLPLASLFIFELGVNWYAGELGVLLAEWCLIWIWFQCKWWYALIASAATNIFSAFFFVWFPGLYAG